MPNLLSTGTGYACLWGPDAILSASGAPVTNTPVTIYQSDGVTAATLYTDETKSVTTGSNVVNTDGYGNLFFYANPGVYIESYSVGGVATTKTVLVDPWYTDAAWNVVNAAGNYTANSGDCVFENAASAPYSITLPNPNIGLRVWVSKADTSTNGVTITTPSGSFLGFGASGTQIELVSPYASVLLIGSGSYWHVMEWWEPHAVLSADIPQTTVASLGTANTATLITIPVPGVYQFNVSLEITSTATAGPLEIDLVQNGSVIGTPGGCTVKEAGAISAAWSTLVSCALGDAFAIGYTNNTNASGTYGGTSTNGRLNGISAVWVHQ